MNPWAIGALAWLAAVIAAAAFLRWSGKRRGDGDRLATTAPAPADTRVPEPGPGPGTPPDSPSITPGPGPTLTITVEFYDDGSSKVLDHTRRRRFVIPGQPAVDLSDEALERFLDDLR